MTPAPAIPVATPLTQPFWEGCAAGELRLQHCASCARPFFPPALVCPRCTGRDVAWTPVSGRGTLYSYTIHHRAAPGFEQLVPYTVAIVQLAEGPRLMTNVVDVDSTPEALVLDMPLEVTFVERFGVVMPFFRPTNEPPGAK